MQLNKILCLCLFLLILARGHSQEIKKIEYLFLSGACNTPSYSMTEGSGRASFYIYGAGYHVKAKRDSLADAQVKRRRDFPNVIPSGPEPSTGSSYWATEKTNVLTINHLPYITLEEFYKNPFQYYTSKKLFIIVPLKNNTFDIWESFTLGQE